MSASLIGSLPDRARLLGPVYCAAYRVARRIVNTLGGGFAARSAEDLSSVPVVLFHASPGHVSELAELMGAAEIDWAGRCLLVCDCVLEGQTLERFRKHGASVASVKRFILPGYLVVHGEGAAAAAGVMLARELKLRPIEVSPENSAAFEAAVTLATAGLTPLLDGVAMLLRNSGVRESESPRLAAALFQQTAGDYAHSGKQSWAWYSKSPAIGDLEGQIAGAGAEFGPLLRTLALIGLNLFAKYPEIAEVIGERGTAP